MQNRILNIATAAIIALLITACSPQTNTTGSTQNSPPSQEGRQSRGDRPEYSDLLNQMDTNNDGKLSQVETKGPLSNDFAQIDKDKDGFISEAEFKDAPAPPQRGRN